MAEQEVIKHTKKIYKTVTSTEHSFWYKAKEFALEIFIIVFAVSLSIWFHGLSEHNHQQQDVKEFMLGLKNDLKNDLKEMKEDRKMFELSKLSFTYLTQFRPNGKLNDDSLKKYRNALFNSTMLLPNNGRYEGFKSSGKIGTIENSELQNDIVDFYQENIPTLALLTNYHTTAKSKFNDYFNKNFKRFNDQSDNLKEILITNEAQNLAGDLKEVDNIIKQYNKCIEKIEKIYQEIDHQYQD